MTSTFLSYQFYSRDIPNSLARTASLTAVSREATYYRENIGKVTSIDDLLKDQRLYSYAMKAHGLEDMIYAKAFMRKVLESDTTDPASFARKLVDTRYLTFAKAFNFAPSGEAKLNPTLAQDTAQLEETADLYSESRVRKGAVAASEADYYRTRMGVVPSVDELIADDRLFSYALKAYGLDPDIASAVTIRAVLTSDLSDPQSVANQLPNQRYRTLAAAFSFAADGSVPTGASAQSANQLTDTIYNYYDATGNKGSPAAAAFKTQYYQNAMASVASVDGLLADDKLFDYALTAHGLDPLIVSKETIRQTLTSDLSDPQSFANTRSVEYRLLAAAFNFKTDGTLDAGVPAQSPTQQNSTIDQYFEKYDSRAIRTETLDTTYYKLRMPRVASIDALMSDSKLYTYALEAFGLDPTVESKTKIREVLSSDVSNPRSLANTLTDSRYRDLAAAFNFGPNGTAQTARTAQLADAKLATVQLYSSRIGDLRSETEQAEVETTYYKDAIDRIHSVEELVRDKRLVTYVMKAYGFEGEAVSDDLLKRVLASDPMDPKSFINKPANARFRELAAAFNFSADGTAARPPVQQAQDRGDLLATANMYLRQTMESTAGAENEGVRLALYFQRKAPSITSAYTILADKALLEVVRTALGLPVAMSQSDIDAQAAIITKKLNLADLKDPKKVDKLLARFSVLYDLNNGGSGPASAVSILFGGQQASGIGAGLLGNLQSLRFRG
jgi:hypothetical protein